MSGPDPDMEYLFPPVETALFLLLASRKRKQEARMSPLHRHTKTVCFDVVVSNLTF